ncbi:MAG TPA: MarR family winged helix-turn-helix transcriptional regulator [Candidatus Saccharimonadales bacterium]|nr:MarR family winged helix-turn-helix transcriptional regulator [Candidatus Saccharimonadales bacterium]
MRPTNSGYLLDHVSSILHRQADQIIQEQLGIGLSQFKILELLESWPRTNQRSLASLLGQTEASISRQIKLLQQKGLLLTQVDPAEHRRHLAVLTAKGIKLTVAAREIAGQFHRQTLAGLNQREQEQLFKLLTALHEVSCAPGRRLACDRPGDIETLYSNQTSAL